MIYKFKAGSQFPPTVDAQAVGGRLEKLMAAHKGKVTPELVVFDARSPESPLHPAFEWSDRVAADRYRVQQASYLIRSVVVRIEPGEDAPLVRAFVSVEQDGTQAYTSVTAAMVDDDLRNQVLRRALTELAAWRKKYADLRQLASLFGAIDETLLEQEDALVAA